MNTHMMREEDFYISIDKAKLDMDAIFDFFSKRSHWAKGIERSVFDRCIRNSLCFGVYHSDDQQVGFARVITDFAIFAYILDLFILESCF